MTEMKQHRTVIVGGGMAGLTAAVAAARCGEIPLLLEKYDRPGRKLLATGNGRCNLLNLNSPVYYGDSGFANAVMGDQPAESLAAFWRSLGLQIRYDTAGRGYPCTFSAATVLEVLKAELKRLNVQIRTQYPVQQMEVRNGKLILKSDCGTEIIEAGRLILATGGAAQPKLGGNLDAWPWLKSIGHTLLPPVPALTPLITDAQSVSGLAGTRIRCRIQILKEEKVLHEEAGELIFSEKGISGICVFQCARFAVPNRSDASIDILPDLLPGDELLQELRRRRNISTDETPPELLRGLCLPKLGYAVCKQAGFPLRGEKARDLSDEALNQMVKAVHAYRVHITGKEGFEHAQIMAGGVRCAEIRPDNMESRLHAGLHITGELLNVDGDCGGFNLMFACMSGLRAGLNGRSWKYAEGYNP